MTQFENTELKAAQTKKASGQELTPGDEVLIAVDETNAAASKAVERGSSQTGRPVDEPSIQKS